MGYEIRSREGTGGADLLLKEGFPMIELRGVCKSYRMGGETVRVLEDVHLLVQRQEFVTVIGPSGSGKSTLMNIIGCLDTPDAGAYLFDGQDVSQMRDRELARLRNQKIGFIFQQFNLLQKLTAQENVELPLIYRGVPAARRAALAREALEKVGLGARMRHRPTELSGGQQQRVAIARALAASPSLLLADEPTGNLDSRSTEEIMELLRELHEAGNAILMITHDAGIAARASRRIRIMDGRVREEYAGGAGDRMEVTRA